MASIFPFIQPQIFDPADYAAQDLPMYRDVEWDFVADKPIFVRGNPIFVNGLLAVMGWAWRALKQERFVNEIYTWNYGNELRMLFGQAWQPETKQSEAIRYIRECLFVLPYITDVTDVVTSFEGSTLTIECNVHTVYGSQRLEVTY